MRISPSTFHLSLLSIIIFTLSGCVHTLPNDELSTLNEITAKANSGFYLDDRIWYQDVTADIRGNTIVLTGEAFFQRPVTSIIKKIDRRGFSYEVIDSVTYLPESFSEGLAYGIITVPYTMGRYKPVSIKQEGTEMLYGEPVRLIRELGEYIQVQSAVGYLGYIPRTDLRFVDLTEWNRYQSGQQAVFTGSVELGNGHKIQMGSRLPYLGEGRILLADGLEMQIESGEFQIIDPAQNPLRRKIIESAKQYLGLPYVWGGRSAEGVDCSGFVMQSYGLNSIYLPRDTDEMANIGRIIGLPGWTDAMLPGDLLFFTGSRRLVTHTAIYLGNDKVIHSLGSGVQIQSMNPEDDDYAASLTERFIFAKRIFE